jgi:hypothetical protein
MWSRTRDVACLIGVLWCFTTMPAHTLPLQRKISSRHLAGNNLIIPPYSLDWVPSDLHVFLHLKTFLGGWRFHDNREVKEAINTWQHHSTMQGYKNWCPIMTSASTIVETMSKSSIRYVHGYVNGLEINSCFFFFNSPSELNFWITYVQYTQHHSFEAEVQKFTYIMNRL